MAKDRPRAGGRGKAGDPAATNRKLAQCRLQVQRLNLPDVLADQIVLESAFRDFLNAAASMEAHLAAEAGLDDKNADTWFADWWKKRTPEERALHGDIGRWRAADFHALDGLSTRVSAVADDARWVHVPLDEVPGRGMWEVEPAQRVVPRCLVVLENGDKIDAAERATTYAALLELLIADFRREHL